MKTGRLLTLETALAATALLTFGCPPSNSRLNAPPQGAADRHPESYSHFAYMTDQGLMQDRSIADIHFIPGSAELSGTGRARLARYAELFATHGGSLNYDTALSDAELIEARLQTANRFLAEAVPHAAEIRVAAGLPRGRGMDSAEAKKRREFMLAQTPATAGGSGGSKQTGGASGASGS